MTLHSPDDFIAEFCDHLLIERGLAKNTIGAYRRDLKLFCRYAEEQDIAFPDAIDRQTIVRFLAWSRVRGAATATLRRRLSSLRTLYKFLATTDRTRNNPAREIPLAKDWSRLPRALSVTAVESLINAPAEAGRPYPSRDSTLLELLYSGGLRVSEACGASLGDLRRAERFMRVVGKGGKERLVPLGTVALERLDRYIGGERDRLETRPTSAVFLSQRGLALTRDWVYRMVRFYADYAGLPKWVTPHSLRHTYASHLLEGGADLRVVQELLGHADIRTTEIYTHVDRSQIMEEYQRIHIRARPRRPNDDDSSR